MLFKLYDSERDIGYELEMNELIARITAFNIKDNFCYEVIKAFAIMARTELAKKSHIYGGRGCERYYGYDLCTAPGHCLEYGLGNADIPKKVLDAVHETGCKIITFEGRPIKPYFHYRCGGATENSENVIGSRITYLRKVLCSYCDGEEDIDNERYYTLEELNKLLNLKMTKPDNAYNIITGMFEDIDVDETGRIKSIKIGSKYFKGSDLAELLDLSSTRFNYTPVKFLIKSIGTGHGMGLCQCGANEMAKSGSTCEEILKYYYTGIKIEDMIFPEANKPLKGRRVVLDAGCGGNDIGEAKGLGGLLEKDVNLDIVLRLKELLQKSGASVYLTRESDVNVPLAARAKIANDINPDFFLTIRQNSFCNSSASGTEIYHYRNDIEAQRLAQIIIEELCSSLGTKNRGVRIAEFYLLREVRVTAVYLQLLYITNPNDEEKLFNPEFRQAAAEAIYKAILKYYKADKDR